MIFVDEEVVIVGMLLDSTKTEVTCGDVPQYWDRRQ